MQQALFKKLVFFDRVFPSNVTVCTRETTYALTSAEYTTQHQGNKNKPVYLYQREAENPVIFLAYVPWPTKALNDVQWPAKALNGIPWPSKALNGFPWPSMGFHGPQ